MSALKRALSLGRRGPTRTTNLIDDDQELVKRTAGSPVSPGRSVSPLKIVRNLSFAHTRSRTQTAISQPADAHAESIRAHTATEARDEPSRLKAGTFFHKRNPYHKMLKTFGLRKRSTSQISVEDWECAADDSADRFEQLAVPSSHSLAPASCGGTAALAPVQGAGRGGVPLVLTISGVQMTVLVKGPLGRAPSATAPSLRRHQVSFERRTSKEKRRRMKQPTAECDEGAEPHSPNRVALLSTTSAETLRWLDCDAKDEMIQTLAKSVAQSAIDIAITASAAATTAIDEPEIKPEIERSSAGSHLARPAGAKEETAASHAELAESKPSPGISLNLAVVASDRLQLRIDIVNPTPPQALASDPMAAAGVAAPVVPPLDLSRLAASQLLCSSLATKLVDPTVPPSTYGTFASEETAPPAAPPNMAPPNMAPPNMAPPNVETPKKKKKKKKHATPPAPPASPTPSVPFTPRTPAEASSKTTGPAVHRQAAASPKAADPKAANPKGEGADSLASAYIESLYDEAARRAATFDPTHFTVGKGRQVEEPSTNPPELFTLVRSAPRKQPPPSSASPPPPMPSPRAAQKGWRPTPDSPAGVMDPLDQDGPAWSADNEWLEVRSQHAYNSPLPRATSATASPPLSLLACLPAPICIPPFVFARSYLHAHPPRPRHRHTSSYPDQCSPTARKRAARKRAARGAAARAETRPNAPPASQRQPRRSECVGHGGIECVGHGGVNASALVGTQRRLRSGPHVLGVWTCCRHAAERDGDSHVFVAARP